jgi:hypothetical protein
MGPLWARSASEPLQANYSGLSGQFRHLHLTQMNQEYIRAPGTGGAICLNINNTNLSIILTFGGRPVSGPPSGALTYALNKNLIYSEGAPWGGPAPNRVNDP